MYLWFMLGHGAATGEMHVFICVCDETSRYYEEIFFESLSTGLVLPGMLGEILSFIPLHHTMCMVVEISGLFILWLKAQ